MKRLINSVLTLGKVLLKSKRVSNTPARDAGKPLIIMGNGPSLRQAMERDADILHATDLMAVNFFADTPEFRQFKPRHYILADGHFFSNLSDPNVERLWRSLRASDWPMTLHVPHGSVPAGLPANIEVRRFNMTPAEGYDWLCHSLYRRGLAMPRPRNVMIPAIMEGIREGYREIFLVGADHTWPHTLYVDRDNRVVTVQPHFYKENPAELDRIAEVYAGVRLHEVLGSMVVAFRSYHALRDFAKKEGVGIFNATPESLIDAFPRRELRSLTPGAEPR